MNSRTTRLIDDCLPAICLLGAVGICTLIGWQVTGALEESRWVHGYQESTVASLIAEGEARRAVREFGVQSRSDQVLESSDPARLVRRVEWLGTTTNPRLRIVVDGKHDRRYTFSCDLLVGAAPSQLGVRLALHDQADPGLVGSVPVQPLRLKPSSLLDPRIIGADSEEAIDGQFLARDRSIAVMRLGSGTDREDFVLGGNSTALIRQLVPASGVLVVPGNLWVDRGDTALAIELDSSLTLVVDGNIYLGRSVVVRGRGRLFLVARLGASLGFRDRDGDGAWSKGDSVMGDAEGGSYHGPTEGGGMIYLGLPGTHQSPAQHVEILGSLVADGEIYVLAESAVVHGAVVGGGSITTFGDAKLRLSGEHMPNIDRGDVPGFRRSGTLRPGLLRRTR